MSFAESISNGTVGEFVVWNFFTKLKDVKSVVDVRDDKFFQSVDVDFLIENIDRQFSWVEVKTDYQAHETGNFVYEVSTSGNIGCFEKTKAQIIVYYVPQSGKLYLCTVSALRKYVNTMNLKRIRMGDNAEGYLLPIGDLERTKVIAKEYQAEVTR